MKKSLVIIVASLLAAGLVLLSRPLAAQAQDPQPDPGLVALGKAIFYDTNLSANGTQSCASCHEPEVGFSGPDGQVNAAGAVYEGAIPHRFGNRRPPSAAYAGGSPGLYFDDGKGTWFGGMFWDGRAAGWALGDPLTEQAQGPFVNPLEQALPNANVLCAKIMNGAYAALFEDVWGAGSLDCGHDVNGVYEKVGRSVAAYERSPEVNPYTSKFDLFWENASAAGKNVALIKCGGGMGGGMGGGGMMGCPGGGADPNRWTTYRNLGLTDAELQGLATFNTSADCASCHTLEPGPDGYPLFTDFGYYNIGVPKNPDNPFYSMPKAWNPQGKDWLDTGLGGFLQAAGYAPEIYEPEIGKVKTPTLRNVDLRPDADFVKSYGHNGYFKSLEDVLFFYHWRAAMDSMCSGAGGGMGGGMGGGGMGGGMGGGTGMNCDMMSTMFPAPEIDQNRVIMTFFPRSLEANIVAFLKTLSDGYFVR